MAVVYYGCNEDDFPVRHGNNCHAFAMGRNILAELHGDCCGSFAGIFAQTLLGKCLTKLFLMMSPNCSSKWFLKQSDKHSQVYSPGKAFLYHCGPVEQIRVEPTPNLSACIELNNQNHRKH